MNELMLMERSEGVEYSERASSLRRNDNTMTEEAGGHIATTTLNILRSCQFLELSRLACEVQAGVLIIRGQVSSFYLKQLAQETARKFTGGYRIVNRLEVIRVQALPSDFVHKLEKS